MATYLITGIVCKFNIVVVVVSVVTRASIRRSKASRGRTSGGRVNEGMTLEAERLLSGDPDSVSATIH